jgi:hypothetical protein
MVMMQTHKERLEGDLRRGKKEAKKIQFQVLLDSVSAEREREGEGKKTPQSGKKLAAQLNLCEAQSSTQLLIYKKCT